MPRFVKTAALAFSILMLASLTAACGNTASPSGAPETTAPPESTVAETTAADRLTETLNALPAHDYDGYAFRIFDRSQITNEVWITIDVLSDTITGEPINDAGSVYDIGGLRALFGTMYASRVLDLTSKYEANAVKAQAALDQINASYGE